MPKVDYQRDAQEMHKQRDAERGCSCKEPRIDGHRPSCSKVHQHPGGKHRLLNNFGFRLIYFLSLKTRSIDIYRDRSKGFEVHAHVACLYDGGGRAREGGLMLHGSGRDCLGRTFGYSDQTDSIVPSGGSLCPAVTPPDLDIHKFGSANLCFCLPFTS